MSTIKKLWNLPVNIYRLRVTSGWKFSADFEISVCHCITAYVVFGKVGLKIYVAGFCNGSADATSP